MTEINTRPPEAASVFSAEAFRTKFSADGYFIARGLLSKQDLAPIIATVERAVQDQATAMQAAGQIQNQCSDLPFDLRWDALVNQMGGQQPDSGWNQSVFGPEIHTLLANPQILAHVEALIGPEIWANGDYWIRPKRPHEDKTTLPWHQDSTYYEDPTADILLPTLWIPLVDVDVINGCLEILPGSHTWGLQPTRTLEGSWFRVPVDDPTQRGKAIPLPMAVGDVLFFNNLTFHRSLMNSSDHVRWSIDLRFSRTGTWLPFLETRFPGFRVQSRAAPEQIEDFETWRQRKAFVAQKQSNPT